MKTLYLIGNGFDLAHGLDTRYSSFRAFLSKNHDGFLAQFEKMYNIEPLDDTEPWYTEKAQKQWEESVLKDLWKSFEEEIGNPNVDEMHDMAEALTDGMPEDGVKDTLDAYWREEYGFSRDFQKYVLEWIETVDTSVATVKRKDLVGNKNGFVYELQLYGYTGASVWNKWCPSYSWRRFFLHRYTSDNGAWQ